MCILLSIVCTVCLRTLKKSKISHDRVLSPTPINLSPQPPQPPTKNKRNNNARLPNIQVRPVPVPAPAAYKYPTTSLQPSQADHKRNYLPNHTLTYCNRIGDPLFATGIGMSAALVRIRREARERDPAAARAGEIGYGRVLGIGLERVRRWWGGEFGG